MTHNPVWLEATPTGVRGYFMPEDDTSTIYVYEVGMGARGWGPEDPALGARRSAAPRGIIQRCP